MCPSAETVERGTLSALLSAGTLAELYRVVTRAVVDRSGADRAIVAVENEGVLEAVQIDGERAASTWPRRWTDTLDHRLISCRDGDSQRIDDLTDCRESVAKRGDDEEPIRSLLCSPIEGGIVLAESARPAAFTESDLEWLDELAAHVDGALDRFDEATPTGDAATPERDERTSWYDRTSFGQFDDRISFVLDVTDSILWTADLETGSLDLYGPIDRLLGIADGSEYGVQAFVDEFVHPNDVEELRERIDRIVRGETAELEAEYRIQHGDGDIVRWFRSRAALVDAAGPELTGLATDISEQMDREQRIKYLQRRTTRLIRARSESQIANIAVNAAGEALQLPLSGIHLRDGDVLEPTAVNEAVWDQFGELPSYRADSEDPIDAFVWETFEEGRPVVIEDTAEHERLHETTIRSALVYPLDDYGVFIASSQEPTVFESTDVALGEVLAISVVAALDRTEQEQRLEAQAAELEHKNERLEEFTSIVSHDLRNPLNVALGRVEYVRKQRDDEHLEAAEQALERMEQIIEETLALARRGAEVGDIEPISIVSMVERCWQNVATAEATVRLDFDSDEPTMSADRERLAHVFENLFTNAVEHGGEDVTITVGSLTDRSGIYVEDDGPGIPPDEREQVFESGYTTTDDGTGFGLALVEDIVDAHGWEISLTDGTNEGDGGPGARFEIYKME